MPGHDMSAEGLPPEKLPVPVAMTGIGNSYLAISTDNPQAKAWFEQGLNLLHDFWDYEAARAFEESIRLDPECAMCYWGLYKAGIMRGADITWPHDALRKAAKLSKHGSAAEKLYIKAAVQEEAKPQKSKSKNKPKPTKSVDEVAVHVDSKRTQTLRKLVAMEPEDVQARIFLAESLMEGFDKKGEPRAGTKEGQSILRAILAEHPDDSAANHYWIHAVEAGAHPELALVSAGKLATLAPASGHMVHMPGHIFYRTGDYEAARISFLNSEHVDETYMRAQKVSVNDDWNYIHNLMYLIADLLEAGRIQEATAVSAKLNAARGESQATLYRFSTRDGLTRLDEELPVWLRSAEWTRATAALEKSAPAAKMVNLAWLRSSMLDYTQGMEALQRGDTAAAAATFSVDLDQRVKMQPMDAKKDMAPMPGMPVASVSSVSKEDALAEPLHSFMDVAAMELDAATLIAQGKSSAADAAFVKAAEAERALGYREPPYYIRPVGETRGDALMRAKRFSDAKAAYEAALLERPGSGYPLYGIAQADVALKNDGEATADYARFMKAWARADADLPQMKAAQDWMTSQTTEAKIAGSLVP